jgi:hypothetical protein
MKKQKEPQDSENENEEEEDNEEKEVDPEDEENYEDEEFDDAEMIDTAERIFVRMAELMFVSKVTCRNAFKNHIFQAEIEGQEFDLISPMGFL